MLLKSSAALVPWSTYSFRFSTFFLIITYQPKTIKLVTTRLFCRFYIISLPALTQIGLTMQWKEFRTSDAYLGGALRFSRRRF